MKFNKLVCDKIPEKIMGEGKKPITHIATPEEYKKRLREKLKEEAAELYASSRTEELADVLEVVYALCKTKGLALSEIEEMRRKKADERGSFSKGIVFDGVE